MCVMNGGVILTAELLLRLHFPLEVAGPIVRVADDPALRQLFAREHIAFTECKRIFHPLSGGHHH